ncbi:MAG: hypothetical protein SOU50_05395 [Oscillospiraceae bacterium]|nr:hypothetical protein [Oscillospiraceae bacterium]MDD7428414.1 hypothetical protein [Oscillospiraceae bacterium]MDY2847639.1 hypothetical protein [Oscillospiraceae bacterium]
MDFINEEQAISGLADTVIKGGISLYNAVKYIYSIGENDFYKINIKDAFKVVLNNITDGDSLRSFGLRIDNGSCSEMQNTEYDKVLPMIIYSFAVRLPTLRNVRNGDDRMTDDQIQKVYSIVMARGAENPDGLIREEYAEFKYLVHKGRPLPPYTAEWFKTYIYTHVPSLADITNKNMFLLGFADVLFAMFYACLEEELSGKVLEYSARAYSIPLDK